MKIRKDILITLLAVLFLPLTCADGSGAINEGAYILSGDIEVGGRTFIDKPSHQDRGYFELYRPYPVSNREHGSNRGTPIYCYCCRRVMIHPQHATIDASRLQDGADSSGGGTAGGGMVLDWIGR